MKYAAILKQSLVDYPGEIAAVLFTRGCNFMCPYCQNGHLIGRKREKDDLDLDISDALVMLKERRSFLDAVVISGGEPTLHPGLVEDLAAIKELGYLVKLDTNGTNPAMLGQILERRLADYVAMDIKAPLEFEKYKAACFRLSSREFFHIRQSVYLLMNADIGVDLRTTVVPGLHASEDILEIARYIEGARLYTLQQFSPEEALHADFRKIIPYKPDELRQMAEACQQYVKNTRVVNI